MDLSKISSKYSVSMLSDNDIDQIYDLCVGNPMFYRYCPPAVTRESIRKDMAALPPRMTFEDKFYIGFWAGETLIAIMDLILHYPNRETAFVGLFMVSASSQGEGVGSEIIRDFCGYAWELGFRAVRLGYVKGNPQSRGFWLKNGFVPTGVEYQTDGYTVVVLQRQLVETTRRNASVSEKS